MLWFLTPGLSMTSGLPCIHAVKVLSFGGLFHRDSNSSHTRFSLTAYVSPNESTLEYHQHGG